MGKKTSNLLSLANRTFRPYRRVMTPSGFAFQAEITASDGKRYLHQILCDHNEVRLVPIKENSLEDFGLRRTLWDQIVRIPLDGAEDRLQKHFEERKRIIEENKKFFGDSTFVLNAPATGSSIKPTEFQQSEMIHQNLTLEQKAALRRGHPFKSTVREGFKVERIWGRAK